MQPFHATGLHRKIDNLMDRLFGAGVASHATIIEQINYLMFLRALTQHDEEAKLLNPDHDEIFNGELKKYRWDNLLMLNAEVLFDTLEEAYRKLPELTTDKTVALLYRNAHIKIYDKPTLRVLVHEIEKLVTELDAAARHGSKDIFGDMYEYLLSKLAQAGTNGQFRTPRHIIKFMVDVVNPEKGETILDPACGTGGFLVEALNHLRTKYTSERFKKDGTFPMDELSGDERDFIFNHAFTGFDSDEDMVKFGVMNLYLHNLSHASIKRQNTLVDTAGDRTKWDVILANPPFAGKIEAESVSEDLRMGTRATEVLFVRYMIDHLSPNGKAAIVVPEGIIFQTTSAHTELRQRLIDSGLWCVVSLPAGVFQPYSGVKTSILLIDKELTIQHKFDRLMFININTDGFELNAQRRATGYSDLDSAREFLLECKKEIKADRVRENLFPFQNEKIDIAQLSYHFEAVKRSRIIEDPTHSLNMGKYSQVRADNSQWPMVELGDEKYFKIESGGTPDSKNPDYWNGSIKWATLVDLPSANLVSDIESTKRTITESGLKNSSAKILPVGTVLVSSRATIGRIGIARTELATNQGFKNIVIRDQDVVLPEYVAVMITYLVPEMEANASGGTFKEISKTNFSKLRIPLPPIDVQNQIVKELDNYQKIADSAQTIVKTYKADMAIDHSWPLVKLGELIRGLNAGVSVNSESRPKNEGEKGILKTSAVTYGVFNPQENKVIIELELDRAKINPKKDCIIISRMNTEDLVGASAYVDRDYADLYLPDRLWQAEKANDTFSMKYVHYIISSPRFRKAISGLSGGTSGSMKNITKPGFLNLEIPLPSLEIQLKIVNELESEYRLVKGNQELAAIYQKKIADRISEVWED
ncbi:MAG: hypothetical protein NVS3B3_07120 [Aquirhabdus sp.]